MFTNMRFEPAGMTDDPDIRFATSLVDYIFRASRWSTSRSRSVRRSGILTVGERLQPTLPGVEEATTVTQSGFDLLPLDDQAPSAALNRRPAAGTAGGAHPSRGRSGALLRLRRHHAASRLVPRVPVVRRNERLLVARAAGEVKKERETPRGGGGGGERRRGRSKNRGVLVGDRCDVARARSM